ncbi:hypothetical protein RFI_09233 [Reticulomyxa filosa]|uniref:Uncharacterized protein n=1 Tax=Reticulomyxa filosa TaxID=46433 RepID=X6NQE1_RETFI|nr:hypothetical protein RFI_09233 [Reticulomyxa filosa]|eukprot:ETO27899.1 hypothetical protein RFI_09233 [Reticulomyxa filosa]
MIEGNLLLCDTLFKVSNISKDCDLWLKGYHLFSKASNEGNNAIALGVVLRPGEGERLLVDTKIPIIPSEHVMHFICSNCDGGYLIFELYTDRELEQLDNPKNIPVSTTGATTANNRGLLLSQCRTNRLTMKTTNYTHRRRQSSVWSVFPSCRSHHMSPSLTQFTDDDSNTHAGDIPDSLWLDLIIGWKYNLLLNKCELFVFFHEFSTIESYRGQFNGWEVACPSENINIRGGRHSEYSVQAQVSSSLGKEASIRHITFAISYHPDAIPEESDKETSASPTKSIIIDVD